MKTYIFQWLILSLWSINEYLKMSLAPQPTHILLMYVHNLLWYFDCTVRVIWLQYTTTSWYQDYFVWVVLYSITATGCISSMDISSPLNLHYLAAITLVSKDSQGPWNWPEYTVIAGLSLLMKVVILRSCLFCFSNIHVGCQMTGKVLVIIVKLLSHIWD